MGRRRLTAVLLLVAGLLTAQAAWLLAVGFAKTGKLDDVLAPLQLAVAGDFGKWGTPSLEHPALKAFLATPTGQAWSRRVDRDRAAYLAALARAIVVVAAGTPRSVGREVAPVARSTRPTAALPWTRVM